MMQRLWIVVIIVLLALGIGAGMAVAQDTPNAVNILFVVCDTRAIMNLNGTMPAGYDVYYQVFNSVDGSGVALTQQRRIEVDGVYQVSDIAVYDNAATVAANGIASARVLVALEGVPSVTTFDDVVFDVQDGCLPPSFALTTKDNASDVGEDDSAGVIPSSPILSPFGGFLNPGYTPRQSDIVVIGARPTTNVRQETPGLIFAECDQYPVAFPGLVYDTDTVTVFWSWFAKTPEQVQQHIDNAIYEVGVFDSQPFTQPVVVSDIVQRGRDYWVFYTVTLGKVKPGGYPIEFKLSWEQAITDGYDDFGPGTDNERFNSTCTLIVTPNPEGRAVSYTYP